MWDQRYNEAGFAYGDQPNGFLVEQVRMLKPGTCLCLAEGQGRNAIWLAQQGFSVTAMDQSPVGMTRAQHLAAERGVAIDTQVGDLTDFDLGDSRWDNIVSIFGHLPSGLRRSVHQRIVQALKPGGVFLLEAYTPEQLDMPGTGGPSDPDMLPTAGMVRSEAEGLEFMIAREVNREVNEGDYHHGMSAVVQIVARKPIEG